MAAFSPDEDEFQTILKDSKEGGPREAGRYLASVTVQDLEMDDFKEMADQGQIPDEVNEWLSQAGVEKGQAKQIRRGFKSRISELLDSLERSKSWEGFSGLSEADRWLEIRKR